MFEDTESAEHHARVRHSQSTNILINALTRLKSTDFTKMMGSGIMISLTPITEGQRVCDEFMIAAEDMEQIKPYIISSITTSLKLRRITLQCEHADITKAIDSK